MYGKSAKSKIIFLVLSVFVLSFFILIISATNWNQIFYNNQVTFTSVENFSFGSNFTILWSKEISPSSPIESGILVNNGKVYFSEDDGNVWALNDSNGSTIYKTRVIEVGTTPDRYMRAYNLINENNSLWYVGGGNQLYALNISNGSIVWNYSLPYYTGGNNAVQNSILKDGKLFITTNSNNTVICINATSGSEIWKVVRENTFVISPLNLYENYLALSTAIPLSYGNLSIYNITDGSTICSTIFPSEFYIGASNNGIVYGITWKENNLTYAINMTNCQQVWNSSRASTYGGGTPIYWNDNILMLSTNSTKYFFTNYNITNGNQIYNKTLNAIPSAYALTNNGILFYAIYSDNMVYAINISDGLNLWNKSITFGGNVLSKGAFSNGNYYLADDGGYIYKLGNGYESDLIYPIFSNYLDNNASLTGSGTAWFNVTVQNTNGTVWVTINGSNYFATNLTANVYNVSVYLTNGTYLYNWTAYGNGTNHNINISSNFYYTINDSISNCVTPADDLYINSNTILCNGTYYLNDSAGNGVIIINASNVILQGNNTLIVGNNSGIGIYSVGFSNVTIETMNLSNYYDEFNLQNGINITVNRNNIFYYAHIGISLGSTINSTIKNNLIQYTVGHAEEGINGWLCNNTLILNNTIRDLNNSNFALVIGNSNRNQFINNTIYNYSYDGIVNDYSSDCVITGNNVTQLGWANSAINLDSSLGVPSDNCVISFNYISAQTEWGLSIFSRGGPGPYTGPDNISIFNNTIYVGGFGISLQGDEVENISNTRVYNNKIYSLNSTDQCDAGFRLNRVVSSLFYNNEIQNCTHAISLSPDDIANNLTFYNNLFNYTEAILDGAIDLWTNINFNTTYQSGTNIIGGNTTGGNFWSGYTGVDTNGDGIGDAPFGGNFTVGNSFNDYLPLTNNSNISNLCMDTDNDGFNYSYYSNSCLSNQTFDCDDNNKYTLPLSDNGYYTHDVTFCPGTYYINTSQAQIITGVIATCNNTIITGNGSTTFIKLYANSVIQNCNFTGANSLVYLSDFGNNSIVRNNNFYGFSSGLAVLLPNSLINKNVQIYGNTFKNNTCSSGVIYSAHNLGINISIYNNTFENNNKAIYLENNSIAYIFNNNFTNTTYEAIKLISSINNTIKSNYFNSNGGNVSVTGYFSDVSFLNISNGLGNDRICNAGGNSYTFVAYSFGGSQNINTKNFQLLPSSGLDPTHDFGIACLNMAGFGMVDNITIVYDKTNLPFNSCSDWTGALGVPCYFSDGNALISNGALHSYTFNASVFNSTVNVTSNTYQPRIDYTTITTSYYALNIDSNSLGNLIYNNYFNNTNNAYDSGIIGSNDFNSTKIASVNIVGGNHVGGNWWNDYVGYDTNYDGIGEVPYPNYTGVTFVDYLPYSNLPPTMNVYLDLPTNGQTIYNPINFSYYWTSNTQQPTATCTLYIDSSSNNVTTLPYGDEVNVTLNVADGSHSWYVFCDDGVVSALSETRTFNSLSVPSNQTGGGGGGGGSYSYMNLSCWTPINSKCEKRNFLVYRDSNNQFVCPNGTFEYLDGCENYLLSFKKEPCQGDECNKVISLLGKPGNNLILWVFPGLKSNKFINDMTNFELFIYFIIISSLVLLGGALSKRRR